MYRSNKAQSIFLTMTLQASKNYSSLNEIEFVGIPGKLNRNGEYILSDRIQDFFDVTIAQPIFRNSHHINGFDWQFLKIWLFSTQEDEQGYQVPEINGHDLKISSNDSNSPLQAIYVLDNELTGVKHRYWKQTALHLFKPLFKEFVAPPELPNSFSMNPFAKFMDSLEERIDPFAKMKREIFFDALIIQVD